MEDDVAQLRSEIAAAQERASRSHVLVVTTLVAVALAAFVAVSFVGYAGFRVARQLRDFEAHLESSRAEQAETEQQLVSELSRHRQELQTLQRASELEQGQVERSQRELYDTYTRLQIVLAEQQDRLEAMRENNQSLQTELEHLNRQLGTLPRVGGTALSTQSTPTQGDVRFSLGETRLSSSPDQGGLFDGANTIRRATTAPVPGHIAIELRPLEGDRLRVGADYELRVELVNRSRRILHIESLDVSWVLGDKRTGGTLDVRRSDVEPQSSALVYTVTGQWSPVQDRGGAYLEATVGLSAGEALSNVLSW